MSNAEKSTWGEAIFAELIATAFLLIAVVGSGVAAERLCGGNTGLALLVNAIATGAALFVLILVFGPVSGAHMNPVVTLSAVLFGDFHWKLAALYAAAQVAGAVVGTWTVHAMFELPIFQVAEHVRTGSGQWIAEAVATAGLLMVVWGTVAYRTPTVAGAVAAYITGAYWFTASTSFANPAATIGRALTDTFAGIRPADVAMFVGAQVLGLVVVLPVIRRCGGRPGIISPPQAMR